MIDYDAYIQQQERAFWENLEANEDADDRQQFWEENGFEASDPFAEGDRREAEILAANPEADPWELGWEETTEWTEDEYGQIEQHWWVRFDGKLK